ncbi:MAG: endonuclease [Lamprobacter sp.]|uniref:endonuclease n=1 Tax=Lamprobacter sp. TaxID=3100796 RepID=UPI002B26228B|nr:endonuclease [Lamprobacter sp.]MEA3640339.1 endonuclease [Lamprobacter sp.]
MSPSRSLARLRLVGTKLRDIAIGLALVSAVSFIPASVSADWPPNAQRAIAIAREVRTLLIDVGSNVIDTGADWLGHAGAELLEQGEDALADSLEHAGEIDLGAMLPRLGDLLPDPRTLFGDLLGGLIDEWWPQPTLPAGGGDLPRVAGTFSAAKKLLYDKVYRRHRLTAYCDCSYNGRRQVNLRSCGLEGFASTERARRVEAEHVFPAAQFGNFRRCWRQPEAYRACREANGTLMSGRACCLKVDKTFLVAHNDLQNLIPAVGMINGDRRDYNWGMVPTGKRYGACDIRIDAGSRRAQPPDALRGDIARIMFYMRDTYGFRLSWQDEQLFTAWNNLDPPDAWELKRQQRITRLQGMENAYVVRYREL